MTIKKGDRLMIVAEFRDLGDEEIIFVALEDEDGGRVCIQAQLGLTINPNGVVLTTMVQPVIAP